MPEDRVVVVYRAGERTWKWECRRPMCGTRDWEPDQARALDAGLRHQGTHRDFGFGRGGDR